MSCIFTVSPGYVDVLYAADEDAGRRKVEQTDCRLLSHLTDIKADRVSFVRSGTGAWANSSKQAPAVETLLLKEMTRRKKMYV